MGLCPTSKSVGLGTQSTTGRGDSVSPRQDLCGILRPCIQKKATILVGEPVGLLRNSEQKLSI